MLFSVLKRNQLHQFSGSHYSMHGTGISTGMDYWTEAFTHIVADSHRLKA